MRQHIFWRCRDCNSYSDEGIHRDARIKLDYAIWRAHFENPGETFTIALYCNTCKETKGYFHVPSGGAISTAYEGRVEILSSYIDDVPVPPEPQQEE